MLTTVRALQFDDAVALNSPTWPAAFDEMFDEQNPACKRAAVLADNSMRVAFKNADGSQKIGDDAAIIKLNYPAPKGKDQVLVQAHGQYQPARR